MENLKYLTEKQARKIILEKGKQISKDKNYIHNPHAFLNHLISVGRNCDETARAILKRHPTLNHEISPDIVRISGYFHDFGKFNIGGPYYEVEGSSIVLEKGEELGLVRGDKNERRNTLIRIASGFISDYLIAEELGMDFPKNPLYPEFVTESLKAKVEYLKINLSLDNKPLSILELTTPDTFEKQILLYGDMTNMGKNRKVTVKDRLDELVSRYSTLAKNTNIERDAHYFSQIVRLTPQVAPKILGIYGRIEQLAGFN